MKNCMQLMLFSFAGMVLAGLIIFCCICKEINATLVIWILAGLFVLCCLLALFLSCISEVKGNDAKIKVANEKLKKLAEKFDVAMKDVKDKEIFRAYCNAIVEI